MNKLKYHIMLYSLFHIFISSVRVPKRYTLEPAHIPLHYSEFRKYRETAQRGLRGKPERVFSCLYHVKLYSQLCCGFRFSCWLLFISFYKLPTYTARSNHRPRHTSWCSCVTVAAADKLTTQQIQTAFRLMQNFYLFVVQI